VPAQPDQPDFQHHRHDGLGLRVPARPNTLDISGCCTSKYRVDGNCIQFCETPKDFDFSACVNRGVGNLSYYYRTLCTNTSANEAYDSSEDGKDTRKESRAGEFLLLAYRYQLLTRRFAASRSVMGYSVLLLALSTIAFSMTHYYSSNRPNTQFDLYPGAGYLTTV